MELDGKHRKLQQIVSQHRSVAIAFSGGVDSSLLLKVAVDTLGSNNVLALTAVSPIFPAHEIEQSKHLADQLGVRQRLIPSHEMESENFTDNSPQRCFHCKKSLFLQFLETISGSEMTLLEGSNLDDLDDYRPGRDAINQLHIASPLLEAKLTKQEIRDLSHQLGLLTWDKPSAPCLATRFPYGTTITLEGLEHIEQCEAWLRQQGFSNFRVRNHHQLARIEVSPDDIHRFSDKTLRQRVVEVFKTHHFNYVTIDLQGYRSGSMNETLSD